MEEKYNNKKVIVKWLRIEFVIGGVFVILSAWNSDYLVYPVPDSEFIFRSFMNLIITLTPLIIMIICLVKVCASNSEFYKLVIHKPKYLNILSIVIAIILGYTLCLFLNKEIKSVEDSLNATVNLSYFIDTVLYCGIAIIFCILSLIINRILTYRIYSGRIKTVDYCEESSNNNASGTLVPSKNSSETIPNDDLEQISETVSNSDSENKTETTPITDLSKSNISLSQSKVDGSEYSLSEQGDDTVPAKKYGNYNVCGKDIALEKSIPNNDIICPVCGAQLIENASFCHKCGTKIIKKRS